MYMGGHSELPAPWCIAAGSSPTDTQERLTLDSYCVIIYIVLIAKFEKYEIVKSG